jgi:hypothetical protein
MVLRPAGLGCGCGDLESFAIDDCCSSVPKPRPVRYSGQPKATLNRNLSRTVVNVVADAQ